MKKFYAKTCEAVKRLRTDNDGVVSLEYVVLAACVVGVVITAFSVGSFPGALTTGFGVITTAMTGL